MLQAIMVDLMLPVEHQHTYERTAIVLWLEGHTTSPVTSRPLSSTALVPNHTLRSILRGLTVLGIQSVLGNRLSMSLRQCVFCALYSDRFHMRHNK